MSEHAARHAEERTRELVWDALWGNDKQGETDQSNFSWTEAQEFEHEMDGMVAQAIDTARQIHALYSEEIARLTAANNRGDALLNAATDDAATMREEMECGEISINAVEEQSGRWRAAAIQAKNDLREIEREFLEGRPPIGSGARFAEWTSPANTMRWIERMEDFERRAVERTRELLTPEYVRGIIATARAEHADTATSTR